MYIITSQSLHQDKDSERLLASWRYLNLNQVKHKNWLTTTDIKEEITIMLLKLVKRIYFFLKKIQKIKFWHCSLNSDFSVLIYHFGDKTQKRTH